LIIKNKEHLKEDGCMLAGFTSSTQKKILQLKNQNTGLNNKTKNNHGDD